ncbi:ABC transporter ATP-binding protein/permease [Coprococcus eutactus]|jgi:ATP-binding cassette subfamily B protein|uniref:ABC transporter ATP-binding protein n=1 Tax=Clostridia TaxID=186801 RepID=UPI000E4C7A31|nr:MULTISPECIES: ABC transporter ATP-binding protein [Clostridia]MCB5505146.1 ABC transporter ATP-binding protein/permease [Coprococcus eutactus]NSC96947.1 ABC transporter ATP-binding protein [Coprococcus eutactus]NSD35978.1 ABC transporter ATP-binding protein [Coprococcus eutactus]RGG35621.1 ABC transporter ATP-binding protein [Clostridium sp. AF23-6LB]
MRYIKEILKNNRIWVLAYIGLGIFNAFMANYKTDYFQKVIDGLATGTLTFAGVITYGLILLVNYCMNYLDNYPEKKLEYGIYLDFKLLSLRKISTIDYTEYQKIGTGKLVQRIENGSSAGRNVVFNFWLRLIRDLLPTIVFSVYFIWKIDKIITYILFVGYMLIFIITNILLKFLYKIKEKILNSEELFNHFLVRGFMEMLVFRMSKQFPSEIKKTRSAKENIVSSKVKMNMIHEAFFTIFALLVAMLDIGILFYAWKTKNLTVGSIVALIALIENAYTPIAIFNVLYVQYKLDKASYKRFEEFLDLKDDNQLRNGNAINTDIGDIVIKNLSFQYEERKIIDDLSLFIKRGQKIAFVGESGSGKSTVIKILLGLLKYNQGEICLGDMELSGICLNNLYDKVSYISQDVPVFDGTIKENLVFEKNVSKEQMLDALSEVQLSHLVENLAEGLDTEIGEKGTCLSGGEKQRLAFARLWFENPELVILDEATSAMDNLTEEIVMKSVMQKMKDKTVIAIAHRLNSIAGFDRIILFREGKIVGQGTFEELLHTDSYFKELYNANVQ